MPRPVDAVAIDEREPAAADDLEVIAGDGSAPPVLIDPPAVADLDRFAPPVPADRDEPARGVQLGIDRGMLAQEARHGAPSPASTETHVQRRSATGAAGSTIR